jgi:hypothetical protein
MRAVHFGLKNPFLFSTFAPWTKDILQRKVERQVKVLIKNLAIFFLFPSKKFLPFKFQLLKISPQKEEEQNQEQLDAEKFVITQI